MGQQDRNEEPEIIYMGEKGRGNKRNPYLVDYEEQRSRGVAQTKANSVIRSVSSGGEGGRRHTPSAEPIAFRRPERYGGVETPRRAGAAESRRASRGSEAAGSRRASRRPEGGGGMERPRRLQGDGGTEMPRRAGANGNSGGKRRLEGGRETEMSRRAGTTGSRTASRRPAQAGAHRRQSYRRKRVYMQRLTVGLWITCIFLLGAVFAVKNKQASAAGSNRNDAVQTTPEPKEEQPQTSGVLVQGFPAEEFAKHPEWEEDFLTPNEYSRPGDAIDTVTNIFVHYTANPGTSAAQNRSYFEQQKDLHKSVSAHFIIGYEGEIIQCIPLDEIAYAVMTRNYDSVSIECCYIEKDGSFTQETYDSLIKLLAWLIDIYDLDTEDILRHYDCGGKKCPLYYVDNPEAWVQLKNDVDKL